MTRYSFQQLQKNGCFIRGKRWQWLMAIITNNATRAKMRRKEM
jgi:hypothetical protein